MNFHEVRFPAAISLGSSGGIERRTEIVTLVSGHEERNSPWALSRRTYDAGLGVRSLEALHEVLAFYEARRGMLYGFRWKDWFDHKSCGPSGVPGPLDAKIGTGDGVTGVFALTKTYAPGVHQYERPITKPVAGSVTVAVDGVVLDDADFACDPATGMVTIFQTPPVGAVVSAGFEFDVPVRFGADVIEVNFAAFQAGSIPAIPIIEVRV